MPKVALRDALQAIQLALRDKAPLEADDRDVLLELRDDVGALLDRTEEVAREEVERVRGSASRLERLETRYPLLTAALGRLADTLTSMGL